MPLFSETLTTIATIAVLAPPAAAVLGYLFHTRKDSEERRRSREEIAQAESRVESEPERAKPAWDLARITLEAYFNRNLTQISAIFWLSVVVMLVGFSILVWGLAQAVVMPASPFPSALATAAGVVTEFIGATFLFIYRSTIQQAINYSHTLERINSVGMAMQILDTMPETVSTTDLRSRTKSALVQLLVKQAHDTTRPGGTTSPSRQVEAQQRPATKQAAVD